MTFRDMEVLYSRTKYNFNRKLAFLTQLTLIQNWQFSFDNAWLTPTPENAVGGVFYNVCSHFKCKN